METEKNNEYRVNIFRPRKGYMRDEVFIIFIILAGWEGVTFGFQILLWLLTPFTAPGPLERVSFVSFSFPFHFWFTAQFLPLWFIILCIIFNRYIDRLTAYHSRRRERIYE